MPEKNNLQITNGYLKALDEAKQLISKSQEQFLRSANRVSMEVRFNLGRIVDENSVIHNWGKSVIENFSKDLSVLFPGSAGFSERNVLYEGRPGFMQNSPKNSLTF